MAIEKALYTAHATSTGERVMVGEPGAFGISVDVALTVI